MGSNPTPQCSPDVSANALVITKPTHLKPHPSNKTKPAHTVCTQNGKFNDFYIGSFAPLHLVKISVHKVVVPVSAICVTLVDPIKRTVRNLFPMFTQAVFNRPLGKTLGYLQQEIPTKDSSAAEESIDCMKDRLLNLQESNDPSTSIDHYRFRQVTHTGHNSTSAIFVLVVRYKWIGMNKSALCIPLPTASLQPRSEPRSQISCALVSGVRPSVVDCPANLYLDDSIGLMAFNCNTEMDPIQNPQKFLPPSDADHSVPDILSDNVDNVAVESWHEPCGLDQNQKYFFNQPGKD